jgi:hypothetical protein
MSIEVNKTDRIIDVTVIKKFGKSIEADIDIANQRVGFKQEGEANFTYIDLPKLEFDDLTQAQKDSLKLTFDQLTQAEKDSLKLTFDDLTQAEKDSLKGEKGDIAIQGEYISYATLADAQAVSPKPSDGTLFQVEEESNKGVYTFQSGEAGGTKFEREILLQDHILEKGKNKIDLKNFISGFYFDNNTGDLVQSGAFYTTGFQNIMPETSYVFHTGKRIFSKMHFFNSTKTWIGNNETTGIGVYNNNTWSFTTPSNCFYIGFSVYASDYTDLDEFKNLSQLEVGNVTVYEAPKLLVKPELLETDPLLATVQEDVNDLYKSQNYYVNQNKNYNLRDLPANIFYRPSNYNRVKTINNNFLNNNDIYKGVVYLAGEVDTESDYRNVYYRKKYQESLNNKYFQIQFYLLSNSGDISDFNVDTVFCADENGNNFTQITGVSIIKEEIEPGLWRVFKKGQVSNPATDLREIWIGSGFTKTNNTHDLSITGFYSYLGDTEIEDIDFANPKKLIKEIEGIKDRLDALEVTPYNINKTVWWLGDSITDDNTLYLDKLNNKLTFSTQYNIANSGAKFSHTASTTYDITTTGGGGADWNVIWNQVNKMIDLVANQSYKTPDIILISAGTNDFYGTIGDPDLIFDGQQFTNLPPGDSQIQNLVGGLRYSIDTIIENFPDVQIVLITPIQRGLEDNSKMFNIADAIIKSGGYASVEVIDQSRKSGIYGYFDIATNKYLSDNLHPNDAGGQKMANFLFKALKNVIVE